ncbi:MAG: autotransporter domain-containing protein [Bradyrhizobiaceae bacterium]|nr:MAG: autotransporter domain-containing protein [Bradyrhizobiaceae bacterium]
MKKIFLGSVALMALAASAQAADLPRKAYTKAPAPTPVYNWTGFYLSGGGGYGMWAADQQTTGTGFGLLPIRTGGRGFFGTVGGGYDWQLSPSLIAGVFADAQFGNIKGTIDFYDGYSGASSQNKVSYAAGGRLGYLVAPNVLTYVSAGYSHTDFAAANFIASGGAVSGYTLPKQSLDGWFIGGGVENSLNAFVLTAAPNWFLKTDYRIAEYGRGNTSVAYLGAPSSYYLSFKPYVQTVSTSLVYRFNSGAPAYAASAYVPPAPPVRWTGFYLSGGGGYGLWTADNEPSYSGGTYQTQRTSGRGYFGTVGGGYDWQFKPLWVAGVFADAQFGGMKGSVYTYPEGYYGTTTNKTNYAVGGRLGYLIAPNVLTYVNVGYSHADFSATDLNYYSGTSGSYSIAKRSLDGWFLGGGTENSLNLFGISTPGWFMKTEYRVAEYGKDTKPVLSGGAPYPTWYGTFKPYVQTISTSLVYRFNSGQ